MTKSIVGAIAALALLAPGAAAAHTTIIAPEGSPFPYQRWIDESQVPTPDVTIEVIGTEAIHGCPDRVLNYKGCTAPSERKIWIAEGAVGYEAREIFMHEIGHNFDADDMPEWARHRFDEIYGFGGPWLTAAAEPEPMTAGEWFAEAYSQCSYIAYISRRREDALGLAPVYGSEPLLHRRQAHNKACRLIQNLG